MRSKHEQAIRAARSAVRAFGVVLALALWAGVATPQDVVPPCDGVTKQCRLRIPLGRAEVVTSAEKVVTVAIAEPKIADAAVGSEKTVIVNAKSVGVTSLVVYNEGGRFMVYDVEVYVPNRDKQVALHVKVAEVTDNASRELGFDYWAEATSKSKLDGSITGGLFPTKVSGPSSPLVVGPVTDGFFGYSKSSGNLELQTVWRALEEKGEIRVLANPTLVAGSGQEAKFLAGGEFPIPVASSSGAASNGGTAVTVTIEWKEFGVKLDFTPTVEEDGSITLKVAPEVSQLDFTNALALNGFNLPTVVTRKSETTVNLAAGEYLVIGGLRQEERSKNVHRVPILGQIPLLGFFFSSTSYSVTNRDLMVVVSPDVLAGGSAQMPELPTDRPEQK